MVFFPWKLLRGFYNNYLKKDYSKDAEDEIRGQYDDGNYLYDEDGNQLSLDEALDQSASKFDTSSEGNGILGRFGSSMSNLLDMVGNFFGSLGNLDKNELFNQSYSWLNQFTGANLTGAQQRMNEFNAEQAAIQRGWQERMSNTSYQRAVADISQAGLNPALVMGGSPGATTPSGASASGSALSAQGAAILDMIMQKANLAMQDKMSQRQSATAIKTAQIQSDTAIKTAEIQSESSKYGVDINAKLTSEQIEINRKKAVAEIYKLEEEAKTEESKRALNASAVRLNHVSADDVEQLRIYRINDLRASAFNGVSQGELHMVQYAYQRGLIDNGMIEAEVKARNMQASNDEQEAIAKQWKNCLRLGFDPGENMGANYNLTDFIKKEAVVLKILTER